MQNTHAFILEDSNKNNLWKNNDDVSDLENTADTL